MTDAGAVIDALRRGSAANRTAKCRRQSIEYIEPPGSLIATGDLHDNPVNYAKLLRVAGMQEERNEEAQSNAGATSSLSSSVPGSSPRHLTLHEIIHSDKLINGVDLSYRALARVAALKARYPEHVHVLLGNHELAQLTNAGIVKEGVKSVEVFNAGVEYVFGDRTEEVIAAINDFIRSLPIALKVHTSRGDILCSHSLPPAAIMGRFDTSILSRDLTDEDYQPRGAAHVMTWGRGYDAEGLEDLVERWGVWMFILGHEKAEHGVKFVAPNAIILNSDHERGVYLPIDLSDPPSLEEALMRVVPLA
jgi:hypothetical protein